MSEPDTNDDDERPDERESAVEREGTPERDPFDAVRASWGFPGFARDFPREPELDALCERFAQGDYAAIRERAPKLEARTEDAAVKRAALTLLERTKPDPSARILFAFAAALLVFLTAWWITHSGGAAQPAHTPQPVPTVEFVK